MTSQTRKAKTRGNGQRLDVAKTYKLYIGGKFPRSESGRYFKTQNARGETLANISRGSRKDLRESVVVARAAFPKWRGASAYLRAQILYRVAEMLEGRRAQFEAELVAYGVRASRAAREVAASVDCLVYYAGWADKYQQIFSSVNPVASSHFNFSMLEPTGIVGIAAPQGSGLLGLVANLAPAIAGGNTVVLLAAEDLPAPAITFAEVLHSSDVPAGVVNVLTGYSKELLPHLAAHMDVNALVACGIEPVFLTKLGKAAAENIKRVIVRDQPTWNRAADYESPYLIAATQEIKTTWHPVGL